MSRYTLLKKNDINQNNNINRNYFYFGSPITMLFLTLSNTVLFYNEHFVNKKNMLYDLFKSYLITKNTHGFVIYKHDINKGVLNFAFRNDMPIQIVFNHITKNLIFNKSVNTTISNVIYPNNYSDFVCFYDHISSEYEKISKQSLNNTPPSRVCPHI
tara:strand:- start:4444 stop:4914 length:471 start_codon:yes stop_codon:yes gene_type:complete